jgi:Baseplate J-like protein
MAEQDIIQNLIFQLGQSQDDRLATELGGHFADIDEQTTADLLHQTKVLAKFVNYYRDHPTNPIGDWSNFFLDAINIPDLLTSQDANTPAHLALLLAFLELYKQPQSVINHCTARHLDFYYQDVLRLTKRAAIADKVHVLLELKKNVIPTSIRPENLFSAGVDATNVELLYSPTRETIINAAKVASLRSLFLDASGHGTVRYAPIANSADGLGGELPADNFKWSGFGNSQLPAAQIGLAIAAPVLRMKEGDRKVTISLQLSNVAANITNAALTKAFDLLLSSEKGWLKIDLVSPHLDASNLLTFQFTVSAKEKAIVDYDAAIHGYAYSAQAPITQILLRTDSLNIGYDDFRNVTIQSAQVAVAVSNITTLQLESDGGTLDAKKAFIPFGSQPTNGSRFLVGYPEALTKKLAEVSITVQWKNAPINFSDYYKDYGVTLTNNSFQAVVTFQDGGDWTYNGQSNSLFNTNNATEKRTLVFKPNTPSVSANITEGMEVYALSVTDGFWAVNKAKKIVIRKAFLSVYQNAVPEPQIGFITFSLTRDFLHNTYRQKYVENVLNFNKSGGKLVTLNEPYTPSIQSISLAYQAYSGSVNIAAPALADFANPDLQFFHITPSGQMREHGYQRQQVESQLHAGIASEVSLFPSFPDRGELLIGFQQLNAGDSVSVLFQVAEGSANPDLPAATIRWFVLCDNYWRPLSRSEVVLDTTNQLLSSGLIQFVIPSVATTQNTILPSGLIWIKAAISDNITAVCQLISITANAVEARFVDQGNDLSHLLTALEPNKITKLQNGLAAIKTVQQPYASFDGKAIENNRAFNMRSSERLRHKNRSLTPWDYERIILAAFPKIHRVKCIPHAHENSWLAPGHVLIVVIPDLKNKNALNQLEPKVAADIISQITTYLQKRAGMQVHIQVKNPNYQKIQLDFKVKFYPSYEFNYYKTQLNLAIIRFLSPWAYQADRDIAFGGKIYKSVLLNFIEDLPYVDYLTDFKMYSSSSASNKILDLNEVKPLTPDTILVSDTAHIINLAS